MRKDRQTDLTKQTVAFRNFANVPKISVTVVYTAQYNQEN
jgi:hypothetical protein